MRSLLLGVVVTAISSYFGLTFTAKQKSDILETLESTFGTIFKGFKFSTEPPVVPEPRELGDYASAFKFTKPERIESLKCMRWEDYPPDTISNVISVIGEQWKLSAEQVKLMQLSVTGGRVIDALEVFEHGKTGQYRFIQYVSARMPNGNYDFMIANYGYSWVMDVLSPEEQVKRLDLGQMIAATASTVDGVPQDMLPQQAKEAIVKDVTHFVNINSKTAITMQEKDAQMEYFRDQSQEALARICPSIQTNFN